jgi:hypothetical protein
MIYYSVPKIPQLDHIFNHLNIPKAHPLSLRSITITYFHLSVCVLTGLITLRFLVHACCIYNPNNIKKRKDDLSHYFSFPVPFNAVTVFIGRS